MGELYEHMKEPDAYDQFVVTYDDGKMTQVFLNKRPEGIILNLTLNSDLISF